MSCTGLMNMPRYVFDLAGGGEQKDVLGVDLATS